MFDIFCSLKIATSASEVDGEGRRPDLEASAAPMDTDAASISPEEQEQTPEADGGQEPGQIDEPEPEAEPDQEPEPGMIDGETDAEVDTTAMDSENK